MGGREGVAAEAQEALEGVAADLDALRSLLIVFLSPVQAASGAAQAR